MLTLAVVTYRSAGVVGGCLTAIAPAAGGAGPYRIVVVDNSSDDDTLAVARAARPDVEVLQLGRNAGYAAAINAAAAAYPADPVLVLNPDVRLRDGAVAALLAAVDQPGAGIAVPMLVGPDGSLRLSLRRAPTIRRALGEAVLGGHLARRMAWASQVIGDPQFYKRAAAVDWASGAAMLVSRACLDRVGPWDESFFLYGEEVDFALRAGDHGFEVRFVPEARAVHLGGDQHRDPALWALAVRNRVKLYRKRHSAVATAVYRSAVLLNEGLRAATGSPAHRAGLRAALMPRAGAYSSPDATRRRGARREQGSAPPP